MTDRPDDPTVLRALALFLEQQVRPAVAASTDPASSALRFRVRVAAHLLTVVASQWQAGPAREQADLDTARRLLDEPTLAADQAAGRLVAAIRAGSLDEDPARQALMDRLRDELAIRSPTFDPDARVD